MRESLINMEKNRVPASFRSLSRRGFVSAIACTPAALLLIGTTKAAAQDAPATTAPQAGAATSGAGTCAAADTDGMRAALSYVETSQYGAAKNCLNCEFWRAAARAACGGCTLIDGAIAPNGYCDSWAITHSFDGPGAQPVSPPQT